MDNYDNDESYDEDIQERQLFGKMNSEFESNQDDPYVTIKDSDDDEEEENPDDFGILKNDLVVLAARAEEDASHLEVWVYQEAITNEETHETEANLYVHHDVMLPAFPLCLAWMDCCKDTNANIRGSYCAVGTMYPGIEIWDLDCIDAVEPVATLGGYDTADIKKSSSGGKSKPKVRKEGHQDAVLGMSWNSQFRNVLASASADKTVKVWDVSTEKCTETLTRHTSKVQCLEWNREERTVLVSGGFDKHARVCDVRAPKEASLDFNIGADCESVLERKKSCRVFHIQRGRRSGLFPILEWRLQIIIAVGKRRANARPRTRPLRNDGVLMRTRKQRHRCRVVTALPVHF